MTAKELDTFVNTLRDHGMEICARGQVVRLLWKIAYATESIGMKELTKSIDELQWAIDEVDALEVMEMGTFR